MKFWEFSNLEVGERRRIFEKKTPHDNASPGFGANKHIRTLQYQFQECEQSAYPPAPACSLSQLSLTNVERTDVDSDFPTQRCNNAKLKLKASTLSPFPCLLIYRIQMPCLKFPSSYVLISLYHCFGSLKVTFTRMQTAQDFGRI